LTNKKKETNLIMLDITKNSKNIVLYYNLEDIKKSTIGLNFFEVYKITENSIEFNAIVKD
jgi:hypothetical protein